MGTDIALFLRDAIAQETLLPQLEKLFGVPLESEDVPKDFAQGVLTYVEYPEGFAIGVGIAFAHDARRPLRVAAQALADHFNTEILLDEGVADGGGERWIVVAPGLPRPRSVLVRELRHGLQAVPCQPSLQAEINYRYG